METIIIYTGAASTPQLEVQEKGKVSEKEFCDVRIALILMSHSYYFIYTFNRVISGLARDL